MSDTLNQIKTQIVLIQADIEEICGILNGDSQSHKGLVYRVNELVLAADRGRFGLRVIFWLASSIAAAATRIAHFKQAIVELFRQ